MGTNASNAAGCSNRHTNKDNGFFILFACRLVCLAVGLSRAASLEEEQAGLSILTWQGTWRRRGEPSTRAGSPRTSGFERHRNATLVLPPSWCRLCWVVT